MNKLLATLLFIALIGQSYTQTVKNCNTNTDCTNFDGTNSLSCCYTLTGTSITTGQTATQKICDNTANPGYSKYATAYGFKSVSGSCSQSSSTTL